MKHRLHLIRSQRMTIVTSMLVFVMLLVILQLWLLTATVNAYLGGNRSIVLPALSASALCFALNAGLLRYLYRLE
jgi:cell division protein FtsB